MPFYKQQIFSLCFSVFVSCAYAQNPDSTHTPEPLHATASLNINNNGISLFPNFYLGKPSAIINLSVGKRNLYLETEFRWGINGKPWSYIYWLRYKVRKNEKFGINLGTQLSYVFKETPVGINGLIENRYVAQRYGSFEVAPIYYHSKKFALGLYYLYSAGLDSYAIKNSHFVSLQPKFPNIKISKDYYAGFFPQVFYLVLDDKKGTYLSESLSINKRNFPISLTSLFTYKIKSNIAGDNIVWNVGLNVKF